jgi:hypothetical protein
MDGIEHRPSTRDIDINWERSADFTLLDFFTCERVEWMGGMTQMGDLKRMNQFFAES